MSLKLKTILGIAVIEIALLAILAFTSLAHLKSSNEELFLQRSTIAKQLFATMVTDAVISLDLATLDALIENALNNKDILYIRVRDTSGKILASGGDDNALSDTFQLTTSLAEARALGRFDVRRSLVVSGADFGSVEIGMSLANTEKAITSAQRWLISISLVEVLLVALFGFIVGNAVTQRIGKFQLAARKVADGKFGTLVSDNGSDELSQFAGDFNRMSVALAERQALLQDSKARLAATVGAALDGVIVVDANGKIIEFNEHASNCFGYDPEYAIGRDLAELIIPEKARAQHAAGMKRYLETGETKVIGQRVELEALHADGHEIPVEIAIGAANACGEKIFVAYVRDISERRNNEQALRDARKNAEAADEAKSRFLAVMSHEMRTPLNGITGVLQLLRDTQLNEEQGSLIETADRSGEVLLDLINDVLDISKMEAGKLHLSTTDFLFQDLIKRVEDILKFDVETNGNTLSIDVDDKIPSYLHGDNKRLCQVLLNLTNNANKFTSNGRIDLVVKLLRTEDNTAVMRFAIRDSGIGIPDDQLKSLFSEFTSLDDNYNRRRGGTGLGLSICRHLVGLMGGQIRVNSRVGEGSEFWFDIALPVSEVTTREHGQSRECKNTAQASGLILLAEDNQTNRLVATKILTAAGYEVCDARNGKEAVAAAKQRKFDAILMDISMPELDGMEATSLIRKLPDGFGAIPIIAMTAHSLSGDREKFIGAGMDDYVTKPIRKQALLDAVRRNLDHVAPVASPSPPTTSTSNRQSRKIFLEDEIEQLCKEVGRDMLTILLTEFKKEVAEHGEKLTLAIEGSNYDFDQVRKSAHSLKGSSATLGAVALAEWAASLEQAAKQQDSCKVRDHFEQFTSLQALLDDETRLLLTPPQPELV